MTINVTLNYDGNSTPHGVNPGTTAQQVAGNNYIRSLLGLPSTVTPLVNGVNSTAPLQNGDVITFQSAPSQKAEEEKAAPESVDEDAKTDEAPGAINEGGNDAQGE